MGLWAVETQIDKKTENQRLLAGAFPKFQAQ